MIHESLVFSICTYSSATIVLFHQGRWREVNASFRLSVKDDYIAIPCSVTVYYKPEMVAFKLETNEMQLELSTSYVQDRFG